MFRKIVAVVILLPLAILLIAFAVANHQVITISLDPFSANPPAAALTLPLFAVVFVLLIVGALFGGIAAWLRQGKWRRTARRLEAEVAALRNEIATLKPVEAHGPFGIANPPPRRLKLAPPVD